MNVFDCHFPFAENVCCALRTLYDILAMVTIWDITNSLVPAGGGTYSCGFTINFPQQGRVFGRDLLETKSKSPLFPGGGGAVVTND